jgi:hypothetical protein
VLAIYLSNRMSDWKNEDDIKAELRHLTGELKHLREELRSMVSPSKPPNPSRAFLHRQSWPSTADETKAPPRRDTERARAPEERKKAPERRKKG